jgi:peroxiredoxin
MHQWDSRSPKAGEKAPDLDLLDEAGRPVTLSQVARGPLLVLTLSDLDDPEGRSLLREYRDVTLALRRAGVALCAVAHADPASLRYMRSARGVGFPLLADPDGVALSRWGMLEGAGLFLLDRDLVVKQRALGTGAPADGMLNFVKRGGARTKGNGVGRILEFFQGLRHALLPLRQAR